MSLSRLRNCELVRQPIRAPSSEIGCDGLRMRAALSCANEGIRTTAAHYAVAAGATRGRCGRERAKALAHPAARGPSGSGSALADCARAGQLRASALAQRPMGNDRLAARSARSSDLQSAGGAHAAAGDERGFPRRANPSRHLARRGRAGVANPGHGSEARPVPAQRICRVGPGGRRRGERSIRALCQSGKPGSEVANACVARDAVIGAGPRKIVARSAGEPDHAKRGSPPGASEPKARARLDGAIK